MLIGCNLTHKTSFLKSSKQATEETSKLLNYVESEYDDYAPKYTQIWRSKDRKIIFKFVSKYGFKGSFSCNITGEFYGAPIEIYNTWEPKEKYDGEMYFSTDRDSDKLYELFHGEYKLSKNKNSLIFVIRKVYNNIVDKHGIKKGDKIVFEKVFGTKAQTHKNQKNKTNANFNYTFDSKTKTLIFNGKGIIQQGIEDKADNGWTKIKDPKHIVVNSGITGIGDFTFSAVDKDEDIAGDTLVKNYFSKIEDIKIPDTVNNIGETAFYKCKSLQSVKLPSKLKIINNSTFGLCSSLSSVTMGGSVEKIDSYAFEGCKKLASIELPDSLRIIGYKSFGNCVKLSKVKLSNSTESIALNAFIGCEDLKEVTIPASVTNIGVKAFGYLNESKKNNDFTIKGYKGTAAEKYAKKNKFKFVALKKK